MSEAELHDKMEKSALIMHCADGFYFIDALPDVPLEKQAKDNGERNAHVEFVTTVFQKVLWERDGALSAAVIAKSAG